MSPKTTPGQARTYRKRVDADLLTSFQVTVKETDLMVYADHNLAKLAKESVLRQRGFLENYLSRNPEFGRSKAPWRVTTPAPAIARAMAAAGAKAGVGPMAAVAGAIAAGVGQDLRADPFGTSRVVVENGGDIFIDTDFPLTVGIYAGSSPLSFKVGLRVEPDQGPLGVCTSSGSLGHSVSFGNADAVCILSASCALADACATAVGNRVKKKSDIKKAIDWGREIEGVKGIVVIMGDAMGAWGEAEIVSLPGKKG
jgi:uncharacterized protein